MRVDCDFVKVNFPRVSLQNGHRFIFFPTKPTCRRFGLEGLGMPNLNTIPSKTFSRGRNAHGVVGSEEKSSETLRKVFRRRRGKSGVTNVKPHVRGDETAV